jgi:hypothetical protein
MALTRDFKQTVVDPVRRDQAFARALLDEAATLFLNGEPDTARLILRDLVNATVGFETLAAKPRRRAKACTGCCRRAATRAWTISRPSSTRFARNWEAVSRPRPSKRREGQPPTGTST